MKWLGIIVAVAIAFLSGYRMGLDKKIAEKIPGLGGEFAQISQRELQEYMQLKDDKAKYEKANEILGRVMMLFIADMGLRVGNPDLNILDEAQSSRPPLLPAVTSVEPVFESARKGPAPHAHKPSAREKSEPLRVAEAKRPQTDVRNGEVTSIANATGAVNALYLGILWREPDEASLPSLMMRLRHNGWNGVVALARDMVGSAEFQRVTQPGHKPEEIINHMYAVFLGRCPSAFEMAGHVRATRRGYSETALAILEKAHTSTMSQAMSQIYSGGFNVNSCKE